MIIEIWNNRDLLISSILQHYKDKTIERVLSVNTEAKKHNFDNWANGYISNDYYNNGVKTINWIEAYEYFPLLEDFSKINIEEFFKQIKDAYNYHCTFVLEHINDLPLIFNHLEYGLGYWSDIVIQSLKVFSPYSDIAKELLVKLESLDV